MPVLPTVNEAIKLGLNFTAAAPPMLVASMKTMAQVVMTGMGFLPAGPFPIPVIPFGAAISLVIQFIEYMINLFFQIIAKIIQIMVELYAKLLRKAQNQRKAALNKLYDDEKEKQKELRERRKELETRIPEIYSEMEELKAYQESEKARYDATVFEYSTKAKEAKDAGDDETAEFWENMVASLEEWLVSILLITIEIMNKKLEVWELEREIKKIIPLTELDIIKQWEFLEEWADDFEVPIPFYPDLPDRPNLPTLPVLPKGNCITEKLKQMLGKWLTSPMVPPIGLAVGAVLECVRAQMAPLPAPIAAKVESVTDGIVTQMGMVI